jgi:uncharacterized protein (TIGR03545 family)
MRWKFVIPVVILTILIVGFNILFLDAFIRKAIISAGEMAFGAKVDVASVKTKFSNMSVAIAGITVANRQEPMKNMFEAGSVSFSMRPLPLLSKKLIIEEMAVDGIAWGTARKVSGALPPKKEKKYVKAAKKENKNGIMAKLMGSLAEKGKAEINALPAVDTIKNMQQEIGSISLDKVISAADLSTFKEIESMKTGFAEKYKQYEVDAASLADSEKTVKEAQAAITELSQAKVSTLDEARALQSKLQAANAAKVNVEKRITEIKTLQAKAMAGFGEEKEVLKKLEELKDADYRAAMEKLKIPSFSKSGIGKSLFGPMWVGRAETLLRYVQIAREHMPPKEEKKPVKTRLKGRDVSFPVKEHLPTLLINTVRLSGSTGGAGKQGAPMDFKGVVTTITSDPVLVGVPTKAEITGTQEGKALALTGIMDHTGQIPVEEATIVYSGLTAKEMSLPSSEYLPSFEKGLGKVGTQFKISGEDIDANIDLLISGLGQPSGAPSFVSGLWAGIDSLSAQGRLSGTAGNLNMDVTSNIDSILTDRLSKMFGAKVNEAQQKVRAEIDRLTNQKKQELLKEFSAKKEALKELYESRGKELTGKSGELSSLTDSKKKEAQNQAEAEKRKAQQQLEAEKNKAADQFKNMFK